jgi:hypothetical protein
MADYNPEVAQQFEREMLAAGKSVEEVKKSLELLEKAAKKVGISLQDFDKFNKELKKNTTTMGGLFTEMVTGRKQFKDLSYTLDNLNNDIEEMEDQIEKANDAQKLALRIEQEKLIANRQAVQQVVAHNAAQKAAIDSTVLFGKGLASVGGVAAKTIGGFAKGLQDGSSAFGLAGGIMEGAIDGMNAGAQAVGGGMSAAGQAMATSTNPKIKTLGIVAGVAGSAVVALGDAAASAGKFIVGFMVKQLEQTVTSFQQVSSVGATFAGGMTEMVNSAGEAGLTVKQFSDVLKNNREQFADSGLGMTEAAKKMGSTFKAGGDGMRKQLLNLGYTYEEQAGLVADIMADMRKANSAQLQDPQAIAVATQDYAKNLKTIAAITGEDARAKMEETRKANAQVVFRQKLMELDKQYPGTFKNTMQAMSTMTAAQQQNLRETIVFGNVINKAGAVATATSEAMGNEVGGMAERIKSGNIATQQGLEESQRFQAQKSDQFRKEVESGQHNAISMASMAGANIEAAKLQEEQLRRSDKFTEDGIKSIQSNTTAQANANDELTNNTVSAAKAAQQMAVDLQNLVLPQLTEFSKLSKTILDEISKQIGKFKEETGKESLWDKVKDYGGAMIEGAMTGGQLGAAGGAVAGMGIGSIPGAVVGGVGGAIAGATIAGGTKAYERNKAGGTAATKATASAPPGTAGSLQASPPAPSAALPVTGKSGETAKPTITKLADFLKFGGNTGDEAHFNQLEPAVKTNFIAMAQEYFAQTGKMLQINSAFRTPEEQAAVNSGSNPKAAPGKSLHNVGRALDINSTQVADLKGTGLLGKYGFGPLAGDPPHIQALDGGGAIEGAEVALVGEKGPELVSGPASVTSRADTSELFNRMNSTLEAMLRVLKDQHGTSEKILWATS